MSKYLYSEIFDSVQGEGEYTGYPTAWLRFFLCNLQCNGFGQEDPTDPSTYQLPYEEIDITDITSMEELPVWEFGCDSSYSWAKKFKKLQRMGTPLEIANRIKDSFENDFNEGKWLDRHLCFTGGEPLMKHAQQCSMDIMKQYIAERDFPRYVTYETNGTQPITVDGFVDFWKEYRDVWGGELFISCSPKLWSVAGEKAKRAIKPDVVHSYMEFASKGQLKFVCNGTEEAWNEIEHVTEQFRYYNVDWPVWIMPVGATVEGQKICDADVATEAFKRGYRVSARVHTYIWGNIIGV